MSRGARVVLWCGQRVVACFGVVGRRTGLEVLACMLRFMGVGLQVVV